MNYKGLNLLIIIKIIILLIILKAKGCHIVYFDKEIITKNVTYISIEIKTKYCFADRRICNFVNRVPRTKIVEEFQLVPKKRCCTGYEEQENGECKPKCNNCENGKCIYTDFCVCNIGYKRNYGLNKCVSRCETDCINAECIGNNLCECNKGYKFLNNSLHECIPDCTKGDQCLNGICIEPDKCNCSLGYLKNIKTEICEPICIEKCENGICTGPNECTCNHGYSMKNNSQTICEPLCSSGCPNGKCIDTEKCQCNDGYEEDIIEIEENNNNNNNYTNNVNDYDDEIESTTSEIVMTERKICKPICPMGCVYGFCTKPNICECQPGFKHIEKHEIKNNLTNLCIPVCQLKCINGNCIGPNQCECHNGYQHTNNNLTNCEPICEQNCHKNGICIAPNKCVCKTGFLEVNNKCYSECDLACKNGICDNEHKNCICSDGYEHPNVNTTMSCLPVCNPNCGNGGICTKPNQCTCHNGYEFNEQFKKCLKPCPENAICKEHTENELIISDCMKGYELNNDNNELSCIPICEKKCKNGICIGPNICQCLTGYDNTDENLDICEPICDPLCQNSNCIEPNVCKCLDGYHKTNQTILNNECEPICPESDCLNGYCIGPNHCKCLDGYELSEFDNMICEPICNPTCTQNISKCIAPNVCNCLDGYEFTITTPNTISTDTTDFMNSTCIPLCNDINCTNGICISPNNCKCFDGYVFDYNINMCQTILLTTMKSTNDEINSSEKRKSGRILTGILGTCIAGFCLILLVIIGIVIRRKLKNRGGWNLHASSVNLVNPVYEID